jgi:hypothetical protein
MSSLDDQLWSHLVREHGHLFAEDEQPTPPTGPTRRILPRKGRLLVALAGLTVIVAVVIVLAVGTGTVNGPEAYAVVDHPDGTVTITIKEISAVSSLNRRLSDLGIRVKALISNPSCTASIQELEPEWKALYPTIVTQNGPAPQVTIRPDAIPANATLLLVGQQHLIPGKLAVLLTLIRSPAPSCMGNVFRPARPPAPGTGVPPRKP